MSRDRAERANLLPLSSARLLPAPAADLQCRSRSGRMTAAGCLFFCWVSKGEPCAEAGRQAGLFPAVAATINPERHQPWFASRTGLSPYPCILPSSCS